VQPWLQGAPEQVTALAQQLGLLFETMTAPPAALRSWSHTWATWAGRACLLIAEAWAGISPGQAAQLRRKPTVTTTHTKPDTDPARTLHKRTSRAPPVKKPLQQTAAVTTTQRGLLAPAAALTVAPGTLGLARGPGQIKSARLAAQTRPIQLYAESVNSSESEGRWESDTSWAPGL